MKLPVADPRPSKANSEARSKRKKFEKENPHFNMREFGMKAGALALLTAVAVFPWEKEYEKHERSHHPDRQDEKDSKDKRRDSGREGRGERRGDDGRRRRQSEGGEREKEYRKYLDRDREYRALDDDAQPSSGGGSERDAERRMYTGSDDGEYGERYVEASRRESERMDREYGRRRRGSMDHGNRRRSRDDGRW